MICLDSTTKKITAVTLSAPSAALQFTASYADITVSGATLGSSDGTFNDTPTDIVVAPASGTQRQIKYLCFFNSSSGQITVDVVFNNNGSERKLNSVILPSNASLSYTNEGIWEVQSSASIGSQTISLTGSASEPSAPSSNTLLLYSMPLAERMMARVIGPSGLSTALQPFLARNKIGYWCPPGNATTVPGVLGFTAFSATGTATSRSVATSNMFTRMRRLGYVSSSASGSLAAARVSVAQITVGDGVGNGGFFKCIRFGCSDAATVAGARQFVGVSSSTSAPSNVEPSTLTNSIGVGHGASDSNLFIYYGGSSAQTPIDLGANFPANTLSADVYELTLFAPSSSNNVVYYEVTRLNTGHISSGTLTGAAGVAVPADNTLLGYSLNWRSNNATALAVGLDIMSDYIETDY